MPKFVSADGKQWEVEDAHIAKFATQFPDATTIIERKGKQYEVKASDMDAFNSQFITDQPHPNSTIAKVREEVKSEVSQPSTAQVDYEALGVKAPAWGAESVDTTISTPPTTGIGKTEVDKKIAEQEAQKKADAEKWLANATQEQRDAHNQMEALKQKISTANKGRSLADVGHIKSYADDVYEKEIEKINQAERVGAISSREATDRRMIAKAQLAIATTPKDFEVRGSTAHQVKELSNDVNERMRERGRELDATTPIITMPTTIGAVTNFDSGRLSDKTYKTLAAAKRSLDDAQKIIDEADHQLREGNYNGWQKTWLAGVGRGVGDKLFDVRTWDMGLTDMSDSSVLLNALNKADNGEELTEEERILLDAKAVEMATNAYFGSYLGRGYKAGSVTAESIPFMLEMAINPMAGVGSAAQNKLVRYALKKFGKGLYQRKLKYNAIKYGTRLLGDLAGAAGMSLTTSMPRTAADAINRQIGQVKPQYDEYGQPLFGGTEGGVSAGKAWRQAISAASLERFSEMMGYYFPSIHAGKLLDKPALSGLNNLVSEISQTDLARWSKEFMKRTRWDGPASEYFEEVGNNILNGIFVGDMKFDTSEQGIFNLDNNIDTLQGVAIIGGSVAAINTAYYPVFKYIQSQKRNKADREAGEAFGEEWEGIRSTLSSIGDTSKNALRDLMLRDDVTPMQKRAAAEYFFANGAYHAAQEAGIRRMVDEHTSPEEMEVSQSYEVGRSLYTPEEMNEAKLEYESQRERIRNIYALEEDADVDAFLGDDPLADIRGSVENGGSEEEAQAKLDYLNAKATYDGMLDQAEANITDEVERTMAQIDKQANKNLNGIQQVTLNNGEEVFVLDGVVDVDAEGNIKRDTTDDNIIYLGQDGKAQFAPKSDIASAKPFIDLETYKQQTRDQIVSVRSDEAVAKIDGVQPMEMGNTFKVMDERGLMHEATITGTFEDGSVAVSFDGAEPQQMQRDAVQSMADAFKMAELQEKKAMQEQEERAEMEKVEAQLQEDKKAQAAEQPKPTALSRIPQDENGQPMYEEADADTAWDAIVEKANGNEATAQRVADAAVKKAEKALNEVAQSTLNEDMSIDEMIEAENAHNDAVAKAQANLDKWKEIAAIPQRRAEAAQQQAEQQAQAEAMQERIDKANEAVAEEQNKTKEQRERKIKELQSKIQEWLSVENVSWAEGRTLNESIEKFGNDVEPIAILPTVIKKYFPELTSLYLYSGKGYLIDHAANHHPELSADEYNNIQQTLDEYDDIKDLSTSATKKVAFIKMLAKGYAVVTELSEKDGKIMLHKTFFYKDAQGKRTPYKNKPSLLKKTSVDGSTTISPAETAAGRHRNISALDASSENKDTTSEPQMQETLQEKSPLQRKVEQRMRMSKARAAQQGGRYIKENIELGEYLDFYDYVMRAIATGGVRFKWGNNPRTGTRGLAAHTGFGEMERRKRIGILSNENGLYPEVAAEELLQAYAEDIGYTPNIDTSDALSTILDVVMTYTTPKDMIEGAKARHAEMTEKYAEMEAQMAEDAYIREQMEYDAMLREQHIPLLEEHYEEFQTIFAEEYLKQDEYDRSRENKGLQQGVHREARNAESSKRGGSVLQETQSHNEGAVSASTTRQGANAATNEPSNSEVYTDKVSGKQESAEVSDESVPFRTTEAEQPTGKKLSRAENMLRIPLRKRINAWSRKVGVPVVMLEDFNDAPVDVQMNIINVMTHGQRVTGWVSGGKVYFYMPMMYDIKDVDDTYIHEVVAHKGLKEMLGEEKYKEFCLNVFNNLMNEEERKFYLNYEGVSNVKDEETRKAKAADEYIAHLSESTNLNKREASVWDKIVDLFQKMLESLGFEQKISKLAVEDMIRQSYRNLAEKKDNTQTEEEGKIQFSVKGKKMKGAADRNSSEFRQPTITSDSPSLSRFGAKLRKDFESAIENVEKLINLKGRLSSSEFLYELDEALSADPKIEQGVSDYIHIGDSVTLRISDHYSNTKSFADNNNYFRNFGIVVRPEHDRKSSQFKDYPNVEYVEYVYFPDLMDADKQQNILQGIKEFIKSKDFNYLPTPDNTHTSGDVQFRVTPAIDAMYMEAVERGDMAMAQRMVQEAAEHAGYMPDTSYQGSLAFNGAAPTTNVYFETKEERKQAWDNDEFDDTMSLGDYADNGIDTNDLEWRLTDPGNYRRATQYEKESIDNINKALKNPEHKITIYRAIPNSVEESSIRNGDWVTPSRSYAEYHIGLQDWNGGRIIEQEVSIDDIWWGGNDINEWGYDDGSNYGYRNTENNRKLLDTVVYDDAGNIIPLSERFNPDKADVRFSVKDNPSLVGVHNLSLDKLRKVIKMGGLANPSVAVIDADKQTHEDYGEYSLILPKNMVDARQGKNAGTWAGDAWTPTYPQITKRMSKDKDISRFFKDIDALPEPIRGKVRLDFDSFMDGRSANALAYWYLFDKGVAPELVDVPARYPSEVVDALNEATNGSFSMYRLSAEERAKCVDAFVAYKYDGDRAAYDADMAARKERLENFAKNHDKAIVRKKAQEDLDSINEYGFDYDEISRFIHDVEWDVRHKGEKDIDATIKASMDYIAENNLGTEYDAWRNNLDERYGIEEYIFDGYTNSGTPRYLPHTVENASKWMKKQGRQGAVATFPSFGTLVAVSIPKMTTLDSIRKRKNLLGKPQEEYDAFTEKWENVYFELGKKLQPDAKGFDNYGYWRLIEAVGQKNPKEYIKKQYNIELSDEDVNTLNEMLNAIRTDYPARYFETKFERPLQLNDFVAAVVPDDVPMDVWGRLNDANVKIFEYKKGDNNSRAEAMQEATATEDVRFRVSPIEGYTAEEVIDIITPEIENILNENGVDNAAIAEVWLHGSRMRGDAKRNSDLDAVLFYKGNAREDNLFDIIADNAITIDGVKVDVNPIQIDSEEDIARYKQKSQQYDAEKLSQAKNDIRFRVTKKSGVETVLQEDNTSFKGTAISSSDGTKILNNLDNLAKKYEEKNNKTKTFIGDVADALSIDMPNKSSKYKEYKAINGVEFTIRVSNHNATTSHFDKLGEDDAISIVISRTPSTRIVNDGNAHIVEFYYTDKKLRQADGKPLVEIIKSIKQSLYSGEYKDTTGLAEREEINVRDGISFRVIDSAPAFYSNAERAVENVSQAKATPEQWLKMIEKNGGLKAGEDKWLGLSDWLKSSDKKTLTKDEVLDYIKANEIQIEEVVYGSLEETPRFKELRNEYKSLLVENDYNNERTFEAMVDMYGEDFELAFEGWGNDLHINDYYGTEAADAFLDARNINDTRIQYTTDGLDNKREIALTVPTIESWNESDEIHFGDAGNGRAVAWVRFGETTTPVTETVAKEVKEFQEPYKNVKGNDVYQPIDSNRKDYVVYGKLRTGDYAYVVFINDKGISSHNSLEEARNAMNEYYKEHPQTRVKHQRVLVIDEVQSKRHQEGREKGYSDKRVSQQELYDAQEAAFSQVIDYESALADKYGEDEWASLATAEEMAEYERLRAIDEAATNAYENYDKGVPAAPFEKNWAELAMKRMLRYAAENGFDKVAWTKGEQQAERYNIGSSVDKIISYTEDDAKTVRIYLNNNEPLNLKVDAEGKILYSNRLTISAGQNLSDVVGKEVAVKIMRGDGEDATIYAGKGKEYAAKELSGDGHRIGSEGMKAFYDQMLPSFMNKYGKKWGVKVEDVNLPNLEESAQTMHSVDVTEAMRESVMEGQPMFRVTQDKARFDALQQEYDALDKNDEAAVNAFNEKKKSVVKQYLDDVTERYALPCKNIQVFNEGNESEIFQVYQYVSNKFNQYKSRTGLKEPIPTFEEFRTMFNVVDGAYCKYINVILFPISAKPKEQTTFETIIHEQTHAIVEKLQISDRIKRRIWREAKNSKFVYKDHIDNSYDTKIEKGDEVLAYTTTILSKGIRRTMFEEFLNGNISVEEVLKSAKQSLPLRNKIIEQILTYIKDEQTIHNRPNIELGREREETAHREDAYGESRNSYVGNRSGNREGDGGGRRRRILDSVAQQGLPNVVGNGRYDAFLDKAFKEVPQKVRYEIADRAKRIGWDFRVATQEYLASLAENNNQEVLGYIRKPFEEMLRKADIYDNFSDNDIRYMMWRTNQLQNYQGALSVAEDVVMKQKLGIDNIQPSASTSFRIVDNRRSIRNRYEKEVNTGKGKLKATAYNFQEATQVARTS